MLDMPVSRIEVVRIKPHRIESTVGDDGVQRWSLDFGDDEVRRSAYPSEIAAYYDEQRRNRR